MNLKRIQDLQGEKAKQKARNLADRRKLQDERENFTKERQYFHKEILPFLYPHKVEVGEMKWRNRSNATLAQELGTRLLDDPRKCEMGSQMSVPHAMSTLELGGAEQERIAHLTNDSAIETSFGLSRTSAIVVNARGSLPLFGRLLLGCLCRCFLLHCLFGRLRFRRSLLSG